MDQSKKPKTCSESNFSDGSSASSGHNLRAEMVVEQEEKLCKDKLNEQFLELGNALDPNRPKRDKVTILNDTIQVLKDLMNQVERLKAEYTKLSQESRELIQEKCELKEEKATLTSDIEILRVRSMAPWVPLYNTYPIPVGTITQDQSTFIPCSDSVTEQASVQQHSLSSGASDKQDSNTKSLDEGSDHKDDVCLELVLKIHDSTASSHTVPLVKDPTMI